MDSPEKQPDAHQSHLEGLERHANEAPREVWISVRTVEKAMRINGWVPACAEPGPSDVRYVRADLVPSVPPVGEREFRLAEAVVYLLGDLHEVKDDKPDEWADSIVAEARAILSSPEPDPASEPRAKP